MTTAFWYPFLTLRVRLRAWQDARQDARAKQWLDGFENGWQVGFKAGRRTDPLTCIGAQHPLRHSIARVSLEELMGGAK